MPHFFTNLTRMIRYCAGPKRIYLSEEAFNRYAKAWGWAPRTRGGDLERRLLGLYDERWVDLNVESVDVSCQLKS